MRNQKVRLVTFAWGEKYVDRLLDFTLASVMAPRNLPALSERFDCTVVIVTEKRLFTRVRVHPLIPRIEAIAQLSLIEMDDLVGESWQYGITLANALFRGIAELGSAMTETYCLFLNADFVLADGSYEHLIPHIEAGHRVLLSPSYCAVEEAVRPILIAARDANGGLLALPARELADLILSQRHNTIRAKTVNQRLFHFEHMDQFYWEVDPNTLLGHQMPISLVAMRPEVPLRRIESFWDWGVVYDFCPSRKLTVLGDSDEFLMLEMRSEETHRDLIRLGPSSPPEIAARMLDYITYYQTDNAAYPLVLHSRELPPAATGARASLKAFTAEVLKQLPVDPIDHRAHPAWLYHEHYLEAQQLVRAETARIAELEDRLASAKAEQLAIPFKAQMTPRNSRLAVAERRTSRNSQRRVAAQIRLLQGELLAAQAHQAKRLAEHREIAEKLSRRLHRATTPVEPRSRWRRIFRGIFGSVPAVRPWHPWYLVYQPLLRALGAVEKADRHSALLVYSDRGYLQHFLTQRPASVAVSREAVLSGEFPDHAGGVAKFQTCLIEPMADDFADTGKLVKALDVCLQPGGHMIIVWCNSDLRPLQEWSKDILSVVLLRGKRITLQFATSDLAVTSIELTRWAISSKPLAGFASRVGRAFSFFCAVPLAVIASIRGLRVTDVPAVTAKCLAVIAVVENL